jgi:hypothetical protein
MTDELGMTTLPVGGEDSYVIQMSQYLGINNASENKAIVEWMYRDMCLAQAATGSSIRRGMREARLTSSPDPCSTVNRGRASSYRARCKVR